MHCCYFAVKHLLSFSSLCWGDRSEEETPFFLNVSLILPVGWVSPMISRCIFPFSCSPTVFQHAMLLLMLLHRIKGSKANYYWSFDSFRMIQNGAAPQTFIILIYPFLHICVKGFLICAFLVLARTCNSFGLLIKIKGVSFNYRWCISWL